MKLAGKKTLEVLYQMLWGLWKTSPLTAIAIQKLASVHTPLHFHPLLCYVKNLSAKFKGTKSGLLVGPIIYSTRNRVQSEEWIL